MISRRLEFFLSITFKDHKDKLEARRDELTRLITLKEGNLNLPMRHLSNAQLDRFTTTLKDMVNNGSKGFRKEYMKMLLSRVDVRGLALYFIEASPALGFSINVLREILAALQCFLCSFTTKI